jgi:hypothetical protein
MRRRLAQAGRATWGWPLALTLAGLPASAAPEVAFEPVPTAPANPAYLRPAVACPGDPLVLTTRLLSDLPGYANRVASRQQALRDTQLYPFTTVLTTSPADLTPLELSGAGAIAPNDLQQVFFTTLERQFWPDRTEALQHHHWLFLAPTAEGWHLAMLYSSLGSYPGDRPPTPPQESSEGIVGQAIRLWLRDCRAGAVFSGEAEGAAPGAAEATSP